jgi:hypothetical protein
MKIDAQQIQSLADVALPLIRQFGGSNLVVAQLAAVVGRLAEQTPATEPIKQKIDVALLDSIAARRKASEEAREQLKWKPPG